MIAANSSLRAPRWWLILSVVAAMIPMIRMARWVFSGSDVQFADYWLMLPEVLSRDGGLDLGGLFTFSNDHAVAIPKLVYWLNAKVAHGSNISLGTYVLAIAAAQVVIVWIALRRTPVSDAARAGLLVLASALMFNRIGAWNFLKAMSGTAWLTANLLALLAVTVRARGRLWISLAIGVLASMSYGTGLAVWPALVVTGLAVDRSTTRRRVTMATAAVVAGIYVAMRSSSDDRSQTMSGPIQIVRFTAEVLGGSLVPFDSGDAEWIGFAIIGAALWATVAIFRRGDQQIAAPWVGFAAFGIAASATVAVGRAHSIFGVGSNRHASLGSIAILGVAGLVAIAIRDQVRLRTRDSGRLTVTPLEAVGGLLALIAAVALSSSRDLDRTQSSEIRQERFAIELLFGLASGSEEQVGFLGAVPDGIEELLERNGHVPFEGSDRSDCGLAGQRVDVQTLERGLPQGVELARSRRTRVVENTRQSSGWIHDPDGRVECIVLTNRTGRVVGAAAIGAAADGYGPIGSPDTALPEGWSDGYLAEQPARVIDTALVAVLDDGRMMLIWSPPSRRSHDAPTAV